MPENSPGKFNNYHSILETTEVGTWESAWPHSDQVQWNRVHARLLGYDDSKTDWTVEDFLNRVHPEDVNRVQSAVRLAIESRSHYESEFRVVWPDGSIHWLLARGRGLYDESGAVVGVRGVLINIDQIKTLEFRLRQKEEGFQALYDANLIGIAFWNADGFLTDANDAYLKLLGLDRKLFEQERPLNWRALTPAEHHPADDRALKQTLEHGVSEIFEKEYLRRDGSRVPVLMGVALSKISKREGIAFAMDMSAQKEAERKIRESQERYAAFISQSREGIWRFELSQPMSVNLPVHEQVQWIFDHAYLAEANDAMAKMYGYGSAAEIVGTKLPQFLPPDSQTNIAYLTAFIQNQYHLEDVESEEVDREGRKRYFSNTLTGVVENGLVHRAWGIQRDVTERKNFEIELVRAREQAELANRAKSSFLANMSHEIRTPLGAILTSVELLFNGELNPKDQLNFREIVKRNGQELLHLIDDILDLSKVEAGRIDVTMAPFSLRDFIDEIASTQKLKLENKSVALRIKVDPKCPETIVTDRNRLRQILNNIIGNAIKFTSRGEIQVDVDYLQSGSTSQLKVTVRDQGIGIEASAVDRLFKPFNQADSSMTRKFGGTGLGLALAKKLAVGLGGDVKLVETQPGVGTVFEITVADRKNVSQVKPAEISSSTRTLNSKTPLHVLLVDDSADNQVLLKRALEKTGMNVELASDGREGVEKGLSRNYDVILMDIQMPVLDGFQATQILRSKGVKSPIIALTAHAMIEDREKCLSVGCTEHISKPINLKHLVEKISHLSQI